MDDLYGNLENFTEEITNAELREENKNLKSKLEEYASTLDKLQKVFDTLSSEHKKLEMNYSSLLKTAKSEIEKKTQIITKLNIEKDTMVLNAIQNRNIPFNRRKTSRDKPNNYKEKPMVGNSSTQFNFENSKKSSLPSPTPIERRKDNYSPSTNTQTSLLNTVKNTVGNSNLNSAKKNEVKENMKLKDDGERSRAQISSRRKSMPASSMDCRNFSTDDDEMASGRSSTLKDQSGIKYLDKFPDDKPSLEDKMFGFQEYSKESSRYSKHNPDTHRTRDTHEVFQRLRRNNSPDRNGKRSLDRRNGSPERRRGSPERRRRSPERKRGIHDNSKEFYKRQEYERRKRLTSPFSPERRRGSPERRRGSAERRRGSPVRKRGSPERRRGSSDRNIIEARDHSEEFYHKQEHERRKRLGSRPKDEHYHDYKSRSDSQRSNDRSHVQDFDKFKSHSQDVHTMKRKVLHDYEEQSIKRSRQDSHSKYEEERWKDERQVGPDLIDLHNMSCQSPDQTHLEALPSHQAREIKLNASAKLEDPRLLSKKYTLRTHDGVPELSTVDSANIEVKVIDTSNWNMIKTIKIPDALLKKPINSDTPSVSLQKPLTSNKPDALLQTLKDVDMPDASLQRSPVSVPGSTNTQIISTDAPETISHKPTHIPNNIPEIPITVDDNIADDSATKPNPTDNIIPDVSTKKQRSTDDLVKEVYMDIENPISSTSADSDELYGFKNDLHSSEDKNKNNKNSHEITRHVVEPQKPKSSSQKLGSYKIPKKSTDTTHNTKSNKDLLSLDKHTNNQNTNKITDNRKGSIESTDETREVSRLNERKISQRRNSNLQYEYPNYITAKDIIEVDLELSDENSDNTDVQIINQIPVLGNKRNIDTKSINQGSSNKHELKTPDLKIDLNGITTQKIEQILEKKTVDTTVIETRKPKARKKSLKLKDTKELSANNDNAVSICKLNKKKEDTSKELFKNKDTSLSMDQLVKIKESIKLELCKDETTSKDKPVKKKDNKSKGSKKDETALAIDKTVKMKENQSKELPENQLKPMEKTVKKKENQSKELSENKGASTVDKFIKKKENKTKESQEQDKIVLSMEKPAKKKQNKQRETENIDVTTIDRQVKNKDYKTKDTKFCELFGDSSSLVSPEDLGLVPKVAIAPSENYVTVFEDAQDAIDMNIIRATVASAAIEISNETIVKTDTSNLNMNVKSTHTPTITTYQDIREPVQIETVPTESALIRNMYQNLQPEISPKDGEVLKMVIISTGTQAQCVLEPSETYPTEKLAAADADLHIMQCVKPTVLRDKAMQALATSTPQKIWQQNIVQAEIDPKISRCSNESREANVDKIPLMTNSDNTTSLTPTNDADEPDVTIFVKRRSKRKVLKNK